MQVGIEAQLYIVTKSHGPPSRRRLFNPTRKVSGLVLHEWLLVTLSSHETYFGTPFLGSGRDRLFP